MRIIVTKYWVEKRSKAPNETVPYIIRKKLNSKEELEQLRNTLSKKHGNAIIYLKYKQRKN